ncbi:DDT domain-containing protein PTM-like isoform X2 [Rutidosis leptorrhynchoides]|uniref:DDT domain-containing protein PTM-like isoform X2 n=1 Tax=Rutidosis leptorrhynchoides TaxID=125765 RepID=UPI003A99B4A5
MEPEVVKRRGRKRKRKEGEDVDKTAKKTATKMGRVPPRAKAFLGKYVKKEFDGSGEFLGKIVSYESGLYRIEYEDGDCEDLESRELKRFMVEESEMDGAFHRRKKALDEYIRKKNVKDEVEAEVVHTYVAPNKVEKVEKGSREVVIGIGSVKANKVEPVRIDSGVVDNGVELAIVGKDESFVRGGTFEDSGAQAEVDSESSSDLSDYEPNVIEVESPLLPPEPELPRSSGNFGIPEEYVSYLLSVYSFLRSFSVCLFLSPFGLDEFVGALNCSVHNTLLDAIHIALMRALKSHVEILSSEGSELASRCLSMDWSLLDSLTWPVFVVQYLTTMRYAEGPEWKEFYSNVLEKDYYSLSAGRKLTVLQLLCDDASNSEELRTEIDNRESSEVGPDPDAAPIFPEESISKKGRPFKTSLSINQEAIKDIFASIPRGRGRPPKNPVLKNQEDVKDVSTLDASASKATESYSGADVDEDDGNGDECRLCGMDGTLICCDGCPSSYHSRCIGVLKSFIPEGEWYCPECVINRSGPKITKTTSLRGAEFFGIDSYEQVFLGSCDHLLVIKTSRSLEVNVRYYSPADVKKVLYALTCSAEHKTLYLEICKGILQYWEIPEQFLSVNDSVGIDKSFLNNDGEYTTSSTLLANESGDALNVTNAVNVNGVGENCKELGFGQSSLNESATSGTENGNYNNKSTINSTCDLSNVYMGSKLYIGSSFKPQAYTNVYIHGDFAASAGASLAILSREEKLGSQTTPSSSYKKFMTANYSLQAKAFSLVAKRFYWPNYEKKLVEVSRERCGWCLSCKATISSKKGCLLNAAAANAIKGAAKILGSISQSKNAEGSLASIATYVMFMEESLCGLTVGPFLNRSYRNHWRKQVEEAATLGQIKAYLLELERNIRDIAFTADWIKLVDDVAFENQAAQSAKSVVVATQKRGPGRRGRKPLIVSPESTDADTNDTSTDVAWWRGGMLAKHIFQKGVLPQMMIKHAARKGGCVNINGVHYVDGLEVPKRSRQFFWRAAVDMSKTASQLALQVRYLDLHVRWNDLVCPEQPLQDGKGPEAEASAFRNACIVDKKVLGNKITYGVVFENQKHLPSRVLKKVLEIEETIDKPEKNWFLEMHIPLYQIKGYEMQVPGTMMSATDRRGSTLSSMHKKQIKSSGKNIFSFLSHKRDTSGICFCTSCQHDVPFRLAARCSACQGYCHENCAVGSAIQTAGRVEYIITCKRCYVEKAAAPKNEIVGDSPTSPLLLQGQESHSAIVIKGGIQNGHEKPLEYSNSNHSSTKKYLNKSSHSKITTIGKQNGNNNKHPLEYIDQSSEKKQAVKSSSTKSKKKSGTSKASKLCLGLIWKKRSPNDTGVDFRLNNLLLKNNPNGHLLAPQCQLCSRPYNSDLMYIRCEKCNYWFHADSVELVESKIMELFGFKCARCRRIRIPICPYTDPEERKKLEAKKAAIAKFYKQKNMVSDSDYDSETNDDQLQDWEPDSTPLYDEQKAVIIHEDYPYPYPNPYPMADQFNSQKLDMDFEYGASVGPVSGSAGPVSGPVPVSKKLPVRRHVKSETEMVGSTANSLAYDPPANYVGPDMNPAAGGSIAPVVQWDVSTTGFEDNMMFDIGDLNYEDMEFEPQTYFSFNELLASDDGVQLDGEDRPPSANLTDNVVNPPAPSIENLNHEQYPMGITFDQQEPMFSVESGLEMVPCKFCFQSDPCPDLFCTSCEIWIHQNCSPWHEDSSWEPETGWKCGNCREWN